MENKIRKAILKLKQEVISLRRDIHKHPELGFEEMRTSKLVEDALLEAGIETKRMAKTGVIGTLKGNGKSKKVLAIRADMDALPIEEENDFEYCSVNKGVMHACGHDAHTAVLLTLAKYLAANKDKLKGTIRFIFQPSEEKDGGALPMIKEGCLKDPQVDAIVALHVWSFMPIGFVNIVEGPALASAHEFDLKITGKGGHAASPHEAIDSIYVASQFINAVQSIISRNSNPFEAGVITFGTIKGGTNFNVIAPDVSITGTLRAMTEERMEFLKRRLKEVLDNICRAHGAEASLDFHTGYIAVHNDPSMVELVRSVAKEIFGSNSMQALPSLGGEDFAYYAREIPGCFFFIGAGNEAKGLTTPHHNSKFEFDEDVLPICMEYLVRIIEKYFS